VKNKTLLTFTPVTTAPAGSKLCKCQRSANNWNIQLYNRKQNCYTFI